MSAKFDPGFLGPCRDLAGQWLRLPTGPDGRARRQVHHHRGGVICSLATVLASLCGLCRVDFRDGSDRDVSRASAGGSTDASHLLRFPANARLAELTAPSPPVSGRQRVPQRKKATLKSLSPCLYVCWSIDDQGIWLIAIPWASGSSSPRSVLRSLYATVTAPASAARYITGEKPEAADQHPARPGADLRRLHLGWRDPRLVPRQQTLPTPGAHDCGSSASSGRILDPGMDGQFDTADDIRTVDEMHIKTRRSYHHKLYARRVLCSFDSGVPFEARRHPRPHHHRLVQGDAPACSTFSAMILRHGHGIMGARLCIDSPQDSMPGPRTPGSGRHRGSATRCSACPGGFSALPHPARFRPRLRFRRLHLTARWLVGCGLHRLRLHGGCMAAAAPWLRLHRLRLQLLQ